MVHRTEAEKSWYEYRTVCRSCGKDDLENILSFPPIPVADALLDKDEPESDEAKIPLTFAVCRSCFHAQIREDVAPDILFNEHYPYYTGISPQLIRHFSSSARDLVDRFGLDRSKKVVEIASNDGTMLGVFHSCGCRTLGVDPATGPCMVAASRGLNVLNTFFTYELSGRIRADFGAADLITANNVLAHVPEPADLVAGIANLLSAEGQVVIEVPHLLHLIKHLEFDGIFHQHYSYFSARALVMLFEKHDLYLNDVDELPIHGGSLRLYFSRGRFRSERVISILRSEEEAGLFDLSSYLKFADRTNQLVRDIRDMIHSLKEQGMTIAGYGAAGKANTLINVCGLVKGDLLYIADLSRYKQGKYFTGAHFEIVSPDRISEDMPQYVLILAWNFKEEIMKQLSGYRSRGGRFIIPIPEVVVIE